MPAVYGANDPVANFAYDLFRSSSGDNLATSVRDVTGTQAIAGSVIDLSDFNIPLGSPIYGHSLFSNDSSGVIATGSDPKHLRTERAARYFASGLSNANFPLAAGAMTLAAALATEGAMTAARCWIALRFASAASAADFTAA